MKARRKKSRKAGKRVHERASIPRSIGVGVVKMLGVSMTCYTLDDGRHLLSQRGVNDFFLCANGGRNELGLPRFVISPVLTPFLSREVTLDDARPVEFTDSRSGRTTTAIDALLVVDVCEAWLQARDAGVVKTLHHLAIAHRADVILRGLARVGIMALVDDAMTEEVRRSR